MNRNQAKEFYPIMQAFAEGKTIECRTRVWELNKGWQYSTTWKETEELKFQDTYEYRIKPKPKYRPFKDAEECWNEMQKHQPFGWVNYNGYRANIAAVMGSAITFVNNKDYTLFSSKPLKDAPLLTNNHLVLKKNEHE